MGWSVRATVYRPTGREFRGRYGVRAESGAGGKEIRQHSCVKDVDDCWASRPSASMDIDKIDKTLTCQESYPALRSIYNGCQCRCHHERGLAGFQYLTCPPARLLR